MTFVSMGRGQKPRSVLLVDDEEALAWSLSTRLGKARPTYSVDTANDGATALAKIKEQPVELLIADVRMPGMSGIELILSALRLYPNLHVIVMTAFKTADIQQLADGSLIRFLEKPFPFERFVSLVDEALSAQNEGFSGAIAVQTLPEIVQLYALSNATGALTVRHSSGDAQIWFKEGSIVHAVTSTQTGAEAFFQIMMWSGGEFAMRLGAIAPEQSVFTHWQELIIESARRIDEMHRKEPEATAPVRTWTLAPGAEDDDPERFFSGLISVPPPPKPKIPSIQILNQTKPTEERTMNIKDSLNKLNTIDGFIGAALVDSESGMLLGQEGGGGMNLEVAAAGNTEVVKAKRKTMGNLGLKDSVEDILITLGKQYHLIRPLRSRPSLFFYVALDRSRANLAMARISLSDVEKDLQV